MPEAELAPSWRSRTPSICSIRGKTPRPRQRAEVKATVDWSVIDDSEKGIAVIRQIKRDYPNTTVGRDADGIINSIQQHEEGRKICRTLTNAPIPDFSEKDLLGNPFSASKGEDKGRSDEFWATCAARV